MVASVLWCDAVKMIKTVLAGSATGRFTDVIEAAFGKDEQVELQKVLDEATEEEEEEEEEMEQGASASTSKGGKCKSSTTPSTSSKRKPTHPSHGGLCHLDDAEVYFPTIADKGAYLHTGVDGKFISAQKSSKSTPIAGYGCLFSQVSQEEAKKYLTVISYPPLKVNSVPISAKPTLESVLVVIFVTRNGGVPLHGWNT